MEGDRMIWLGIGLCTLGLLGEITKNRLIKWVIRMCFTSLMIIVMNCLLPQYMIGFNLYTVGFSSLLGVPGLMTLYMLRMII